MTNELPHHPYETIHIGQVVLRINHAHAALAVRCIRKRRLEEVEVEFGKRGKVVQMRKRA